MEMQSLQEALKVEIQCHQNGELKKQLHERQSRITSLSEKQKLAVRSCPVGSTKPISLVKAPNQSIAISVVPSKNPITMVTAHINGQKTPGTDPPQMAPINLQTTSKLAGSNLNSTGRRVPETSNSQTLGTITAVPIKVPQVSSLQRLAGQRPAVLPQVRPKTLIPDSLSVTLCRDQTSSQPQSLQKSTIISIKNPSPALPTANNTVNHVQTLTGQTQSFTESPLVTTPISSAGVAFAIISASPNIGSSMSSSTVSLTSDTISVQPLLLSTDKVLIIQPQSQAHTEHLTEKRKPSIEQPQGHLSAKSKREENPEKLAFMVSLGLVTTEHLEEIQSRRQERKRRSTANPTYSGLFEPERKRIATSYLNGSLYISTRANEELCWKDDIHEDYCTVCKRSGQLLLCDTCSRVYHLECLEPPLKTIPKGVWVCPRCQEKVLKKEDNVSWPGTLAIVHSYLAHKAVKEEEKRKLLKRGTELKSEHEQLEEKDRLLSNAVTKCLELKTNLIAKQKGTRASLERVKTLIRLMQSEQVIQVTMMTTTATSRASPMVSLPWIKPSAAAGNPSAPLKQQSQGKN
ncbi:PHD finger protein 21B isoform X3 [Amblyraja radiata]|uniref:PHD finger protein 21B isoform X3 n=1 Tax=Amblyraja radiata TaxID=386614 RepID=UPI00140402F8|nr:PHD finger protein 21B isoform X3 [Amblyraja radiata]